MASAPSPYEVLSSGTDNMLRIARLLINGGTKLLRESFDLIYPPSILPKILKDPAIKKKLQSTRLTRQQLDSLYPSSGVCGESTDFDFSLLLALLTTICKFTPPVAGWDALPAATDHSLAADLVRINYYSNLIFSHLANQMEISDDTFPPLWENIRNVFLRIAGKLNMCPAKENELKDSPVFIDSREVQELRRWYATQTEIRKAIEEPKALTHEEIGCEAGTILKSVQKDLVEKEGFITKQSQYLETIFKGKVPDIKNLLRKELMSATQGVEEEMENLSLESVQGEPEETTLVKTTAVEKEVGVRLPLYIDCEYISGADLQGGKKEIPYVTEVDTPTREEDQDIAEKQTEVHISVERPRASAGAPAATEGPALQGGKEDEVDTPAQEEAQGIEEKQTEVHESIEKPGVSVCAPEKPEGVRPKLSIERPWETTTLPYQTEQSSRTDTGGIKKENVTNADIPSAEDILGLIAEKYFAKINPSTPEDLNGFLDYLKAVRQVLIQDVQPGSLIIIVLCRSLEILQRLWEDYGTGLLNEMIQFLVTGDILKEFGLTEVRLKVTILEKEYRVCRDYFLHSPGSTMGTGPKAKSQGAIETGPGSRDNIKCESQAKTDDKVEAALQQDRMGTVSNVVLENIMQSTSNESESRLIDETGAIWMLQNIHAAACMRFPQSAVSKPALFTCTLWESTNDFPPLMEDETLVSNVVQLSCEDSCSSSFTGDFNGKVTVALSHSATNLKGYEIVIRELVDPDNNEWKELETTDIRQASDISDIEGDVFSKLRVPYAEARVTYCSTYAAICRLTSFTYSTETLHDREFTCRIPKYPDVSVTIPAENANNARNVFQLTLKVQEIPQQWFDENELLAGPVLHIISPEVIQLSKPATVTIPMSLNADKDQVAEFSSSDVMLLRNSADGTSSDWQVIARQLPKTMELTNGVVRFQVEHFSRYWILQKKKNFAKRKLRQASRLPGSTPIDAGFFACLCSTGNATCENSQLRFCCFPAHLEERVRETICSTYNVLGYGSGDSIEPLCKDDLINVAPCRGLEARDGTSEDVLMLRFRPKKKFERDVIVRDSRNIIPQIKFFRHVDRKTLCELSIVPPLQDLEKQTQHVVFSGAIDVPESSTGKRMSLSHDGPVPKRPKVIEDGVKEGWPTLEELHDLSQKLDDWKSLGRHLLDMKESIIIKSHEENEKLEEKAYQILRHWKQKKHSAATYHALYTALCKVNRKDLAEEFCCAHPQVPHKIY